MKLDYLKTYLWIALTITGLLMMVVNMAHAARTDEVWEETFGTYLQTIWPEGRDILINGVSKYLNFGSESGVGGYGLRDNAGIIEFKHEGGNWAAIGSGTGTGGTGSWTRFNNSGVHPATSTDTVLIGDTSTSSNARLEVHHGLSFDEATGTILSITNASTSNLRVSLNTTFEYLGTGLAKITAGVLGLATPGTDYVANTAGDWTGTFDGQQGTWYVDRANHTGTQVAATISDFDTEVSNNTDVAANTAARHDAVTLAGSLDYITLSGQQITRNAIDLTTDTTGLLPIASGGANNNSYVNNGVIYFDGTKFTANSGLTYNGTTLSVTNLTVVNATSTQATTTGTLWIGAAFGSPNTGNDVGDVNLSDDLSVQDDAFIDGTLTAGSLTISGLGSGILKASSGVVSVATAGVDYLSSAYRDWQLSGGYLTPTTTQTVLLNNGFVSAASSTVSGGLTIAGNSTTTNATTTGTMSTSILGVGSDYINDITGSGLINSGGALTVSIPTASLTNYDWTFSNTYNVLNLTPTTTIPIWAKGGVNASSTSHFNYASSTALSVEGSGSAFIVSTGNVGIGTASPAQKLNIYQNDSSVAPMFSIEQDDTGDASLKFVLTSTAAWTLGIDNSDSDKFKIGTNGTDVGAAAKVTITSAGFIGVGTEAPLSLLALNKSQSGVSTIGNSRVLSLINSNGAVNELQEIGFGYQALSGNFSQPVVIGTKVTDQTSNTIGSFYVGTRAVSTDTFPVERLTIAGSGEFGMGTSTVTSSKIEIGGTQVTSGGSSGDGAFTRYSGLLNFNSNADAGRIIFIRPNITNNANLTANSLRGIDIDLGTVTNGGQISSYAGISIADEGVNGVVASSSVGYVYGSHPGGTVDYGFYSSSADDNYFGTGTTSVGRLVYTTAPFSMSLPIQSMKRGHITTSPSPARIDGSQKRWYGLYDASTDNAGDWQFEMPSTFNTNSVCKIDIVYTMASASSGNVIWASQIMAQTAGDAVDLETDSFATADTVTSAVGAAAGRTALATITVLNTDSWAAQDHITLRVYRDADNASDTATGDAELADVTFYCN